jgi:hypothetical protein
MTAQAKNYAEQDIAGKRWQRSHRVTITNPYGGGAAVAFDEEQVTEFDGVVSTKPGGVLTCYFDPAAEIPLINPVTLEPTGETMPQSVAYVLLFSLYVQLAQARDAAIQL